MFKKGTTLKLSNGLGVKVLEQLSEGGFAFVRAFAATPAPRLPLPKYLCSGFYFVAHRCDVMRSAGPRHQVQAGIRSEANRHAIDGGAQAREG